MSSSFYLTELYKKHISKLNEFFGAISYSHKCFQKPPYTSNAVLDHGPMAHYESSRRSFRPYNWLES